MKCTEPLGVGWRIRPTVSSGNLIVNNTYTIISINKINCINSDCIGCFTVAEVNGMNCLCFCGERKIEIVEKTGTKPFKDLSHEINIPGMF